ncbi:MAG: helix-turn-helix domain-containing protein [Nocardiopsaceae bacterium]|nr:helix-turn-helix domain-containing protein [Nocardiopsaceae bacterium]
MGTLIRLEDRAADERMDFVREITPTMWVPMEISACGGPDVYGNLRASGAGAMQVVVMDMMPVRVRRYARHVEEADPDMLKLLLIGENSQGVINQGGKQAVLAPGEFAFYDTRRPYDITIGLDGNQRVSMMTFMFPPSMLPLPRDGIRDLAVTRMPAVAGLGELTAQFLRQLARNIDDYTPAEAARLSAAAMEVLATRLARELEVRSWGTHESRRHAMFTTITAFILANLSDPGLSPMTVAAAHHISLRSLHQLFHDEGSTVAGWIRSRRLERCRRDLEDPALDSRPVAAIGARWGFPSAADFSRIFRAAHGIPPAEYRRSTRSAKPLAL